MLSSTHNFIFIHRGKSAGNSISQALLPYVDDEILLDYKYQDGLNTFNTRNTRYGLRKHAGLLEYKQALPPDFYAQAFKFSLIRNPFERLISVYYSPNRVALDNIDLNSFDRQDFLRIVREERTFREYVCTDDRSGLLDEIDFVVRYEFLQYDFKSLCEKLGLPNISLGRYNVSHRKRDYRAYYDQTLIDAVSERFHEEIETFGYTFKSTNLTRKSWNVSWLRRPKPATKVTKKV
ncbi:MAG: sulfotransferase family 2 domain-containing protein [Cyanobacteria bacterium J06639_14]